MTYAPPVRLYVSRFCLECERAVALLVDHELPFELIDVGDPDHCCHVEELQGRATLPQAFAEGRAFSGYGELAGYVRALADAPPQQAAMIGASKEPAGVDR